MNRTICLLTILLGAGAVAVAGNPGPSLQDPPSEEALWKEMSDHLGKDRMTQAADVLEKFIAAYPSSTRLPDAIYMLASFEEQRGRAAAAAERFGEFVRRFPKHDNAPQALLQRASLLARLRKKAEAKEEFKRLFKEYPGTDASQGGLWQYWNLDNKHFQFSVHRTFAEGQPVSVQAYLRNVDRVDYRLFRLDTAALLKRLEAGTAFHSVQELMATVPPDGREKLREWSDEPSYDSNRYLSKEVKIDVPGPGLYIVQAEHDGIPVQVGIVVARYGLIVKSAPNRSVFFSVDRRTGRAVPGMTLRLTEGDKKSSVTTGNDGLYV